METSSTPSENAAACEADATTASATTTCVERRRDALDACVCCNGPGAHLCDCGCVSDIPEGDCDCARKRPRRVAGQREVLAKMWMVTDFATDDSCTDLDACNFATVSAT